MIVIKTPLELGVWSIVDGDIWNNEETSNSCMVKNKMALEDL
jgi:hypothetical protein